MVKHYYQQQHICGRNCLRLPLIQLQKQKLFPSAQKEFVCSLKFEDKSGCTHLQQYKKKYIYTHTHIYNTLNIGNLSSLFLLSMQSTLLYYNSCLSIIETTTDNNKWQYNEEQFNSTTNYNYSWINTRTDQDWSISHTQVQVRLILWF